MAWGTFAILLVQTFAALPAKAQWSEDPSDATTSLTANVSYPLTPGEPATCGATWVACNAASFHMGLVSSTTPQTASLAYPPCQTEQLIAIPTQPKDIWFRLDPAFADAAYRFTLFGDGTPAMTMGGMAVYEAPNAGGPFRLMDCSLRGGYTTSNNLPSVEASCITAGNKLYLRIWDRTGVSNSGFSIAVMGQRRSTLPDRGADETPCSARTIAPVGSFTTTGSIINYVFTCDEPGFLPTTPEKNGGDLWVKLTVPASGNVRIKPSNSTATNNMIGGTSSTTTVTGSMGVSAYLASDCSDYGTFLEVGSTTSVLSPGSAASGYLDIKCLPAGATLYLRVYALKEAAVGLKIRRFGQMRLEWMVSTGTGTPPPNCDPCSAPLVTVGTNAWGSACSNAVTGSTYMSCQFPGSQYPICGDFNNSLGSVWYKFVAPPSGFVVIDAGPGAAPATAPGIALYTTNADAAEVGQGCRRALYPMDCDDRQGPGQDARIARGALVPGQVYYVRVWSKNSGPQGNFTLCITSPPPPAGSCWYLVDLYAKANTGKTGMNVTLPPAPATTYLTSGGDPSELFLVAVPSGSSANFELAYHTPINGINVLGYLFWAVWQAGSSDTLFWGDGGYAVAGPSSGPNDTYTLNNACSPRPHPPTDCWGMRTLCLNSGSPPPPDTHLSFQMDNRRVPRRNYSSAAQDYLGTTYRPQIGDMYDLAGPNLGCLDGERSGIQWMVFHPDQNGTVAFLIDGYRVSPIPTRHTDFDFAIWDLGALNFQGTMPDSLNGDELCPPKTAPIRCSSARAQASTGLALGMSNEMEGHGGFGWLKPLDVVAGNGYLIAITPTTQDTGRINFAFDWTLYQNALGVDDPAVISCQPLLLPVELLFLAGRRQGSAVELTWATATERNSSHFIVERSTDGHDFQAIGRVAAAGNSQFRIDYRFTDENPVHGVNYYRLRLVDLDGSTDLSNRVAVQFDGDGTRMVAWPNPAKESLNIAVSLPVEGQVAMRVMDALGRVVMERHAAAGRGQNTLELDTRTLAPGSYAIQLDLAGAPVGAARFVKE